LASIACSTAVRCCSASAETSMAQSSCGCGMASRSASEFYDDPGATRCRDVLERTECKYVASGRDNS
jgi:hypothetical protein